MDSMELLKRIKNRDMNAYLRLTNDYGLKLYSHLRTRLDDKDAVEEAFKRTLNSFYQSLTADDDQDPIDAILCAYADRTCEQMRQEAASINPTVQKASRRSGNVGFVIGITILGLGILAAAWVIVGLLMDMNLIPGFDLGYEWFNSNVTPWF